jgi:hypothetical protein
MEEAESASETSVLTGATRRNIPEDSTLHSHRREKPNILSVFGMANNDFACFATCKSGMF